ncbi:MAG: DUF1990 domain-containing protein [Polyangiaceae bacterium]|jgi:uncharacterized protein (UPF0548 family)|nr:DUF1990 domain-containing protein [Polyangiaceae bacterium]
MMLARCPDDATVQRFLREQASLPFSYRELEATRGEPPAGYKVDRYGTRLGLGEGCYERACAALWAWKMYPSSWFRIFPEGGEAPRPGLVFVTRIHHLGFWSLNSCRILYLIDENEGGVRRRGFAFGTLPGHEEQGEERFEVSRDTRSDEVRYDVLAFSRPRSPLARLGAPIARALQGRFARETRLAMILASRG